jgi:hypothetical protein
LAPLVQERRQQRLNDDSASPLSRHGIESALELLRILDHDGLNLKTRALGRVLELLDKPAMRRITSMRQERNRESFEKFV